MTGSFNVEEGLIIANNPSLNDKSALKLCKLLDLGGKKLQDSEVALAKSIGRR